jgi:hypothetical protein
MVVTPTAIPDITSFNPLQLLSQYFWYIVPVIALVFLVAYFVKLGNKKPKFINRSDIQKSALLQEFGRNDNTIAETIEENDVRVEERTDEDGKITKTETVVPYQKIIYPRYNKLFTGENLLGKITNIAVLDIASNPHPKQMYLTIYRRPLFLGHLFFGDREIMLVMADEVWKNKEKKTIRIKHHIKTNWFNGSYYTQPNEDIYTNFFNSELWKKNMEMSSSIDYVEAQKKSSLDLEHAHELQKIDKQTQLELAKKRGQLGSI